MIVEIAIATNTAPADWWGESDAVLATALDVLDELSREVKRHGRGHR